MEGEEFAIYRNLQEHLNNLPIGFPPTKSGVELKLLNFEIHHSIFVIHHSFLLNFCASLKIFIILSGIPIIIPLVMTADTMAPTMPCMPASVPVI